MSKRDTGVSLATYMEQGFAPEAVVNYLLLLGWTPKGSREIVSLPEVIEQFDLPQIHRHNARFDFTKLLWMDGEYIRQMEPRRFALFILRRSSTTNLRRLKKILCPKPNRA